MIEQEIDQVAAAKDGSLHEGREPVNLTHERIGPTFEEERRGTKLARKKCDLKRSVLEIRPGSGIHVRSMLNEQERGLPDS